MEWLWQATGLLISVLSADQKQEMRVLLYLSQGLIALFEKAFIFDVHLMFICCLSRRKTARYCNRLQNGNRSETAWTSHYLRLRKITARSICHSKLTEGAFFASEGAWGCILSIIQSIAIEKPHNKAFFRGFAMRFFLCKKAIWCLFWCLQVIGNGFRKPKTTKSLLLIYM